MNRWIAIVLALLLAVPVCAAPDARQKAVLVTGASTGIGRKVTERLASEGYYVYAGARKEVDLIEQLVQLNEGQAYTYDRDTLVKMLDEALAQSRPRVK